MICRSRKKIFGIVQIASKYFYVKEESPLCFIFFFPQLQMLEQQKRIKSTERLCVHPEVPLFVDDAE